MQDGTTLINFALYVFCVRYAVKNYCLFIDCSSGQDHSCHWYHVSHVTRKFVTRVDSNRPAQLQSLEILDRKSEVLCYLASE